MPDSHKYMCIHQIPRPATPPLQPNQLEMLPEPEHMDIDIPEDIADLIDISKEILSDFDAWAQSILEYQ